MDGSSNSSFIPKRNPSRPQRVVAKQVYLFTVISYVVFVATLVSAVGVFFYEHYIDKQVVKEVEALDAEISRFNEADMEKVRSFDLRLEKAWSRLEHSVSLATVFKALEEATVRTAQIKTLTLERMGDQGFKLTTTIETNDFDSSLFQREMYEQNGTIDHVEIVDLDIQDTSSEESGGSSGILLSAVLGVPLSAAIYSPDAPVESVPLTNSAAESSETASSSEAGTGEGEEVGSADSEAASDTDSSSGAPDTEAINETGL